MSSHPDAHDARRLFGGGGFSLVELVAVMAIMAVVAATAIVKMSSTSTDRSAMAARALLRDISYARQRSLATGYKTWIDLSTANQWRLLAEDSTNQTRATAQLLTDPATNDGFLMTLNSGAFIGVTFSLTVGEDWIGFNWVGQPIKKSDEDQDPPALAADATYTFSGGQVVTVNKDTGNATFTP